MPDRDVETIRGQHLLLEGELEVTACDFKLPLAHVISSFNCSCGHLTG